MTKASAVILSAALVGLDVPAALGSETAADYKVVVNAANPVTTLTRDSVSRMFLKKTTTWPNGKTVAPVDQATHLPSRRAFSRAILGRATDEVAAYWNQMIFSGRGLPPPTKASDSEVLAFVHDNPNAIGYVAGDAKLGEGVKVLTVQ
jgi:ABC-type phosphate transport system substrate-binding protein